MSLRALRSCSPMLLRFAFFNENASMPNILCGNWVITLGVQFGSPQIFFCIAIIFLSSFLIVGSDYDTS